MILEPGGIAVAPHDLSNWGYDWKKGASRLDAAGLEQAVALLTANRRTADAFDGLPQRCRPADEAEGYAIQAALARQLSDGGMGAVAGAKIGCTTSVMQAYMKIDQPCAGTIYRSGVHDTPAELRYADYRRVGVECEIAVRLAGPLPESPSPVDIDELAACVESCMAAIEIVDDRYRDFRAIDTPTLIGDDFFHAGCVLAPPVTDWQRLDLAAVAGRMEINGESAGTGRGADILGHPLRALAWLAETGQARDRRLGAGSIVMLGSVVKTCWLSAGDTVIVEVDGLGRAEVRFR